jgi:glucose-1-phosphate cytidylyltransferase
MKVVILAGGESTRMGSNATGVHKAMTPIGDTPILWHLIRYYQRYGYNEFVIALGHHSQSIIEYIARVPDEQIAGLKIQMVDTGLGTETGGRIKRLAEHLVDDSFMLTWCDGLADVDLHALHKFHQAHGRLATVTAVHPPSRFGRLTLSDDRVVAFREKGIDPDDWINGAFFVLERDMLFGYLDGFNGDATSFEHEILPELAGDGQLMAYRHEGFWQCMDTQKEAQELNALWASGQAPWKVWS